MFWFHVCSNLNMNRPKRSLHMSSPLSTRFISFWNRFFYFVQGIVLRWTLSLRYRVRVEGLEKVQIGRASCRERV